jgi:hypothetical protein
LVLHVDVLKAQGWSDKQVLALWHTVYKGTLLTQKFMRDEILSQGELISLYNSYMDSHDDLGLSC